MAAEPLPISEREIWACALKILDRHGDDAELVATMHAHELMAAGDLAGRRVWQAILARIRTWRRNHLPSLLQ